MPSNGLRHTLGPAQFFSFSFGVIVGVGWIVLLGEWLRAGGPGGATIAFGLGGAMMALIGLCYAETCAMFPVSGGEMAFAYRGFGTGAGFLIGWTLLLAYIGAVSYVGLSMAWILDILIPGIKGPPLYEFRGEAIHLGSLIVALATCLTFLVLNYRGVRSSGRFQDAFTYGKVAISVVFLGAGLLAGHPANLRPLFQTDGGRTPLGSIMAVLAVVPWFFAGFQTVPQVMEERSAGTSLRLVGRITVFAILAAAVYYCLAILAAGMAMPWRDLISKELPAAAAFREAFGSEILARLVLLAGLCGVATVGNGTYIAATRILFAMSRGALLGPGFAHTNARTGAPDRAVLTVGAISLLGVFLGRKGIGPIVAVGATCLALGYVVTCATMLRLRLTSPQLQRPYRAPVGILTGLVATAGATGLLVTSLYQPLASAAGHLPLEWVTLAIWMLLGAGLWAATSRVRRSLSEDARADVILGSAGSGGRQ